MKTKDKKSIDGQFAEIEIMIGEMYSSFTRQLCSITTQLKEMNINLEIIIKQTKK